MEENSLLISVVIPMYNSASTIVRALDSVKNQSYICNYEVLVVNDGSIDESQRIVENYISKNKDEKFKVILLNQNNSGVSKARNTGLHFAKGNFIAFLDSDDYWLSHKIERQIIFLNNDFDFVCSLRNNEKIVFPYKLIENRYANISLKKLLFKVVGQTSTALFKRHILENTGFFDESQKYSEDANYWMRIAKNNNMIILNETLVKTDNDYGQNGLSSNLAQMEKGVRKNIQEMYSSGAITLLEFIFFNFYSYLKYLRRCYL
ncbi:glycosyltransferase family A protein [Acinetobacter baumannii]|uniref:Glycosyltransferase family 2 protein n=1 Tax=Acinetobacter seifertii TaxID=1530123 RepID=A0A7H2TAE5_9GAMM|nr:glycosyltransferase family 2 protein [Acinetobacter seifertii]QNX48828.1 glycosyltransferase family 2 protein [Acinetobacter seifertii]QNY17281.1 glycosyltransferase family 2 protein [Acinetobacter seifertii]